MKFLTALSILLSASMILAHPVGGTPKDSLVSRGERDRGSFYWNHTDRGEHGGYLMVSKRDSRWPWHSPFWWNQPPGSDDSASNAVAKRAEHGTFWWHSEDAE
ncbi:hypothetical protein FB45DRAFT_899809 [Roridomyces roridus]|uniref:Uncharacterized protein n=1 Tax=Roridomyces roridus TaxID=1738132 RepID=A0AAD7FW29_9AGAR|nr:hypothetical protein FB45DRAFT_899809 [Roridomyces roridus]